MKKDVEKNDSKEPCLNARARHQTEWDTLEPEDLELFNRKVICKQYRMGQIIFLQGDTCKGLYFVESGLVAVRKMNEEGKSAIVRLANQGDTLGYRPFLAKENHRATAEVIIKSVICFLEAPVMRRLLLRNPKLGLRFLESTAQALGEAEERLFQVAALSVRTRIIHLLLLLSDHYGSTTSDGKMIIELPMTKRNLASMIGAQPESVSRAFSEIKADGLLEFSGRTVQVNHIGNLVEELHYNLQ